MTTTDPADIDMKDIVALCKRRGFIFAASDIYGGLNGFWDYGPLGIELKNNLRDLWWKSMVTTPPIGPDGQPVSIVGLDSAIIQNPKTWVASGHVGGFSDPMQTCRQCQKLVRADHVWEMLQDAPWVLSFAETMGETGYSEFLKFNAAKAKNWAERKGKKLAPGLALVRNPSVTLSWLAEDLDAQTAQDGFTDPIAITDLLQYIATEQKAATGLQTPCPTCGGDLTEPRDFNLMFETYTGAVQNEDSKVYLRPETAQGIFLNFKNVMDSCRVKPPFGIAQIGKAYRNEVTPRNFIFRSREFEQMEMEFFCAPEEAEKWHKFWIAERKKWWLSLGLSEDNILMRDHEADELAHYAKEGMGTVDVEYKFPFSAPGFGELEGVAHRCDFDLSAHQEHSGQKLEYFDQQSGERYIPHVIEPAAGLTRGVLAMLCEAYTVDENRPSGLYLNFHPKLAPKKAAILPLTAKDEHVKPATDLYLKLREHFAVDLDIKQNIGKRYARQDEIGTPYCFTVDNDTLEDGTVTIRDRNTMEQSRMHMDDVLAFVQGKLAE